MEATIIEGDLLTQKVEVIVNAWNRNIIPWWLLLPQGISREINRKAGLQPFFELPKFKSIPLGKAVITSAGKLDYKAIIHVAGINMLWMASEYSIRKSVRSAIRLAFEHKLKSIAFPVLGAGSGSFSENKSLVIMIDELKKIETNMEVFIVKYKPHKE